MKDDMMIDDGEPITFEHADGRELELIVDVPVMRRLRHYKPKIDIRHLLDKNDPEGGLIGRLLEDPGAIVDIAYEATRHQTEAPEDPEQFAAGIHGDKLDELTHKVLQAVIRFTPDQTQRRALRAILQKVKAQGDLVRQDAIEYIRSGKLDAAMQKAIEDERAEMNKAGGSAPASSMTASTSSPSSAASTPTPSKGGPSPGSKPSTADEK